MCMKRFLPFIHFLSTYLIFVFISPGCYVSVKANVPGVASYSIKHAKSAITIDGKLDEEDWRRAEEIYMVETVTGAEAPLKTTVKLLWDDTYLYAAFYCEDPDAWATLTEEDDPLWGEEVVEIFIDPQGKGRNYYELEINPINAKVDLFVINRGQKFNGTYKVWKDWDFAGLKSAVYVEGDSKLAGTKDKFWIVEVAMPFEDFWMAENIPPENGDIWRINLYRIERGMPGDKVEDRYYAFSPTLRLNYHTPWRFGIVYFTKVEY